MGARSWIAALLAGLAALAVPALAPARDGSGITRIQGRVLEGRRQPVTGVTVTVRDQDGTGILYVTSTDAKGNVRALDLPDGTYTVTFRKPGYGTVRKADVVVESPLRPVLEVTMAAGGGDPPGGETTEPPPAGTVDVRGRVVDAGGAPVPDVTVRLVRADGTRDPRQMRTGDDGRFSFEELAAGRWRAEVRGVGYLTLRTPVVADRDLDVVLRLIAQPADYRATPLDLMPPEVPLPPDDAPAGTF